MTDPTHNHDETGIEGRGLLQAYTDMRRLGVLLLLGGMGIALAAALLLSLLNPAPEPDPGRLGIHLLLDDGRGQWGEALWPLHMDYAARLVGPGGYVVQLVRSDDLDTERWQFFMDLAAERDLRPILRLATTYDRDCDCWTAPPPDADGRYTDAAAQYAAFVAALDWPPGPRYIILLNEPNQGPEWGGRPDPAAYARFLVDAAAALRAADPEVLVLNAAISLYAPHTGSQPLADGFYHMDAASFMAAMIAAEPDVFRHVDVWNSHPYPMHHFSAPPWQQEYGFDALHDAVLTARRPPAGVRNRGINGYEWELWQLAHYGIQGLPVMITEAGWRYSPDEDPGGEYPTAQTAALYIELAMQGNRAGHGGVPRSGWTPWLVDERVLAVIPFALNGPPEEWWHTNWLYLSEDGEVLGTTPFYDFVAAYHGQNNGP